MCYSKCNGYTEDTLKANVIINIFCITPLRGDKRFAKDFLKVQRVKILDFVGHEVWSQLMDSAVQILKVATDNTEINGNG